MKNTANVVVIGAGVVGNSIAFNLAREGVKDVVVLEKDYLTSGASGRCGAGIRQQWGTEMNCRLAKASMNTFENINEVLNVKRDIELKQGGYLLLAYSEKEINQFRKNIKLQNNLGIPSREISLEEVKDLVPYINLAGIKGAAYCPTDGHANPFQTTVAFAEAAEKLGVEINTHTKALDIKKQDDKIKGVLTNKGFIKTDTVVNAAGGFAKEIGEMVGIDIPVKPERHEIMVTEKINNILKPMVMSFSYDIYCQQTPGGSFIMGYGPEDPPESHNRKSSWDFMEKMAYKTTQLLPKLKNLRVIRQWAGSYTMTPDNQPIIDSSDKVSGFYMAVGFSGHGFMMSPMTGQIIAEKIVGKESSMDLDLTLKRFQKGNLILEPSVV